MSHRVPNDIKVYHIVHWDRLESIVRSEYLWSDKHCRNLNILGTVIGIKTIKDRRLNSALSSHPDLTVGGCVPFYFCPRSVMLYKLHKNNDDVLNYRGGQSQIVHLQADFWKSIEWCDKESLRWAFTNANAGSSYFDDFNDPSSLERIDWSAVGANWWEDCKEAKQSEFLVEHKFPWKMFEQIGVYSDDVYRKVVNLIPSNSHRPEVTVRRDWYF